MGGPDYLSLARSMLRSQFTLAFSHPFIAFGRMVETADLGEFNTRTRGPSWRTLPDVRDTADFVKTANAGEADEDEAQPIGGVLPVVKSERNPYSDRISIGRSRSSDIVLLSPQVSKLHAHFLPGPGGTWELRDAGSSNGTFRNGLRLKQDERVKLAFGDALKFGVLETRFFDAAGLYDWLRKH